MNFEDELSVFCERFDGKCVSGMPYCRNLYNFAESVKAENILEIGFGFGFSALSFIMSLAKRSGKLTSVDPFSYEAHLKRHPERNLAYVENKAKEYGVEYELAKEFSWDYSPSGPYCLVYIDADPYEAARDYVKFSQFLRDDGLVIFDGYPDMWPIKMTVDKLGEYIPFDRAWYSNTNAHAVFANAGAI